MAFNVRVFNDTSGQALYLTVQNNSGGTLYAISSSGYRSIENKSEKSFNNVAGLTVYSYSGDLLFFAACKGKDLWYGDDRGAVFLYNTPSGVVFIDAVSGQGYPAGQCDTGNQLLPLTTAVLNGNGKATVGGADIVDGTLVDTKAGKPYILGKSAPNKTTTLTVNANNVTTVTDNGNNVVYNAPFPKNIVLSTTQTETTITGNITVAGKPDPVITLITTNTNDPVITNT